MTLILLAQCGLTLSIAAWIVTGVIDNWRYPKLNLDAVRMVVALEAMEREYPAEYAAMAHRRVTDPGLVRALFYLIVGWETLAAVLLCAGGVLLGLAALGAADPHLAQTVAVLGAAEPHLAQTLAVLGAVAFTLCWAGFLAGGNYFCYWYCHFPAQATHMFLAVWGSVVTGVLLLPV